MNLKKLLTDRDGGQADQIYVPISVTKLLSVDPTAIEKDAS
jgi:hypothetical protein